MRVLLIFAFLIGSWTITSAQEDTNKKSSGPVAIAPMPSDTSADSMLVTVILKYQQDKSFSELRRLLEANGFWDVFPPADSRVVSWNVAVGFGHIVTLKMPADGVRRLYLAISNGAWGAFNSEVFMSYEYMPIWKDYIERRQDAKEEREDK